MIDRATIKRFGCSVDNPRVEVREVPDGFVLRPTFRLTVPTPERSARS